MFKKISLLIFASLFLMSGITIGGSSSQNFAHLSGGNARASTNTSLLLYSNTIANTGSAYTITHSATLGSSLRFNTAGRYQVYVTGRLSAAGNVYLLQGTAISNTPTMSTDLRAAEGASTSQPSFTMGAVINAAVNDYIYLLYGIAPATTTGEDLNNQLTIIGPL